MRKVLSYVPIFFFLTFLSILTVFELFSNVGLSANMDGTVHITTISMFYDAISSGEFPITWIDAFANYGMPLPLFAHQLPIYIGVLFNFLTHNPIVSYNLVCFFGVLLSNIFFYIFLRIYFKTPQSLLGIVIFNFAPYKILNLYIRGALPEAFSATFLPLCLIGLYLLIQKRQIWGLFIVIISVAAFALSHPMTLVIFSFVLVPYALFLIGVDNGKLMITRFRSLINIKLFALLVFAVFCGIGLAGYYIVPLNLEIKYFYYGGIASHLTEGGYLGISNFFDPRWFYYTTQEIFSRGFVVQTGMFESIIVILGIGYVIYKWIIKKDKTFGILEFAVFESILIIFFTTQLADIFYKKLFLLGDIQFPWRLLASFVFFPPIIVAYLASKYNKSWIIIGIVGLFAVVRFPQLYGKNYTVYPSQYFQFTEYNLHSTNMNTIWTGETESYPIKKQKWEIMEGEGTVSPVKIQNSRREYQVNLSTDSKLVDYTFYFPGWHVYVDGIEIPIEYQDPAQRGVITYSVPKGQHQVVLQFQDTKVRLLGKLVSAASIVVVILLFIFRKLITKIFLNPTKRR